jgi:hypothetical protein
VYHSAREAVKIDVWERDEGSNSFCLNFEQNFLTVTGRRGKRAKNNISGQTILFVEAAWPAMILIETSRAALRKSD